MTLLPTDGDCTGEVDGVPHALSLIFVAAGLLAWVGGCSPPSNAEVSDATSSDGSPGGGEIAGDDASDTGRRARSDARSSNGSATGDTTDAEETSAPEPLLERAELFHLLHSDKGMKVVEPGELASAVSHLPKGGDPRPVQYSILKLREGATYTPASPIRLENGQQIHAYGATIRPQHGDAVFRMEREARIYGGTIDLGSKGGSAFVLPGGRRGFPKGPQGTRVVADSGAGSVGLDVDSENYRGGRGTMFFATDGVDYPVDINILEKGPTPTFYNSHGHVIRAADYKIGIRATGTDDTNANRFTVDFTPSARSKAAIQIDHDNFSSNWFEGVIRNPRQHEHLVEIIESTPGEYARPRNTIGLYSGPTFETSPMWVDETAQKSDRHDKSLNDMIDFSSASFGPAATMTQAQIDADGPGVVLADGSDFQTTLDEAARQDKHVRIRCGSTFNIAGVQFPKGVIVDARGARLEIDTRHNDERSEGIRFAEGALLVGGRLYARMNGGPALTIRADGTTIDEPTGPLGSTLQQKGESLGMLIEAVDGGTIEGLNNRIQSIASEKAFRMRADGSSAIRDNRLALTAVNAARYNLKMHGDGVIADNVMDVNLHAAEEMRAVWIIDGPNVRANRADGHFWDTSRFDVPPVLIERSGGENLYSNFFGFDRYHRPDYDDDEFDWPIQNRAGSDFNAIGYDALEKEPALRDRVAKDRLLPTSFSPFPFESK